MALPNIFEQQTVAALINRIDSLQSSTKPQWGKMDAAQMLAHCNVTYEMAFEQIHQAPGFLMKLMLKTFVKSKVVNEVPYKTNAPTAPAFVIKSNKNFDKERQRLIGYLQQAQNLGAAHFEGKESLSFGVLSATEWNNMFYKHLDHHLRQFGV
jgi:hypothetical protein